MTVLNIFYACFLGAFGIITGCFVGCILWGYVANKLCEWSLDKELNKKNNEPKEKG